MKKYKEIIDCIFTSMCILLGMVVCFFIFTEAMKNIKLKNRMREDSVCIEINKEIYCNIDYDLIIETKHNEV